MSRDDHQARKHESHQLYLHKLLTSSHPVSGEGRKKWHDAFVQAVELWFPDADKRFHKPGVPTAMFSAEVAVPGEDKDRLLTVAEGFGQYWERNVKTCSISGSWLSYVDRLDAFWEMMVEVEPGVFASASLKLRSFPFEPKPSARPKPERRPGAGAPYHRDRRRPGQDDRSQGDRPREFRPGDRDRSDRPHYEGPPRRRFEGPPPQDRPPYGDRPYRPGGGDSRQDGPGGGRPPYGDRPYRPGGGDVRKDGPGGGRPPHGDRPFRPGGGDYRKDGPGGGRPPYGDRPYRPGGDVRKDGPGGGRPPYGDRPYRPGGSDFRKGGPPGKGRPPKGPFKRRPPG